MLLLETLALMVIAPIAGVACRTWQRRAVILGFSLAGGALIVFAVAGRTPLELILRSQLTLGAAVCAAATVGGLCRVLLADRLDAAAVGLVISIGLTGAVLAAGPPAGDLPTPLLNAALLASPLVATASAANIDLLHGEPLYQLLPIAHRRFDYPDWPSAALLYSVVSIAGIALARVIPSARKS